MIYLIPILFMAVAFLYSMAGFGGGSTYTALLAISGIPLTLVPLISLSCNLVVTSQGSFLLVKKGHADWAVLVPLLSASIPAAFIGGIWRLPEGAFLPILAGALTVAGLGMLVQNGMRWGEGARSKKPSRGQLAVVGGLLGLLAGVTGIGGGIYLAPVMHLLRWSTVRTIATCTSLFIALNSLSGLIGQLVKGNAEVGEIPLWLLLSCPLMVLLGGRLGSGQLASAISPKGIRMITAVIILLVAVRLWIKIFVG